VARAEFLSIGQADLQIFGLNFGASIQAYALIAGWCVLACIAMFVFSRTPFVRVANAVRDNPVRAAAIGFDPRRVRFTMVIVAAFFAGVAGGLGLINLELASAEGVGLARSGSVLIAVVIGGTATFFGPVLGAVVLDVFQRGGGERVVGMGGLSRDVFCVGRGGGAQGFGGVYCCTITRGFTRLSRLRLCA
jgi:ABC-type branched-subunit amino acid transport system permease subunit